MGQYFMPVMERNGKTIVFNNYYKVKGSKTEPEYVFLKLTEHSWIGNPFIETIMKSLINKPARVLWVGDYSDKEPRVAADGMVTKITQKDYYDAHYSKKDVYAPVDPHWYNDPVKLEKAEQARLEGIEDFGRINALLDIVRKPYVIYDGKFTSQSNIYLYNISRNEYIDMESYIKRSNMGFYDDGAVDCQHPLPILTATSNEYGGGDYYGKDKKYAGRWCYDEIVVYKNKNKIPNDAKELLVTFNENLKDVVEGLK